MAAAEGEEEGQETFEERFAIMKQVIVGRFIVEIDGDSAVVACRLSMLSHVSSPCRWHSVWLRHAEGNVLKNQALVRDSGRHH